MNTFRGPKRLLAALTGLVLATACSTATSPDATSTSAATGAATGGAANGSSESSSSSTGEASAGVTASSGAAGSSTTAAAGGADPVFVRPKVDSSANVTIAVEENVHDYNNNTSTANNLANAVVQSLTQPSAFINDNTLKLFLDGDVMASVTVTSTSPQTIVWKVRPEAVWSDGVAVDCKDFYLAWLQAESKATTKDKTGTAVPTFDPASTTGFDQMNAPVCSDGGKTITTTFTSTFSDYRSLFTFLVPAHVIEADAGVADVTKLKANDATGDVAKFAAAYIKDFAGYNAKFDLSAGPYLLSSLSDEQVVFQRNPKWWGNPAGPQSLTLLTKADGQSQVQSLQNQEVQVIEPQPDSALAAQLKGLDNVTFNAYAGVTYEHLDFNMKRPLFQGATGLALRQAFFNCVDRQDIITKLVKGVNDKTVPLGSLVYLPTETQYKDEYSDYDTANVAKAKSIMEAAGWKLGPDGVYALANGTKAEFKLGHKVIDTREKVSQLINGSCGKAGIKVNDDQDANFNATRLPAHDFDMALFAWVGTPFKSALQPLYATGGGGNYFQYSNPAVDKLFNASNSELDQSKRSDEFHQADQLIAKDFVSLPLYQFSDMIAQTNAITPTLTYNGPAGGGVWNAYTWVYKQQ